MVCRLELKGNKYILGEFLEFKGKQEDIQALRNIRRSKVSRMTIQHTSMFGLGNLIGRKRILSSNEDCECYVVKYIIKYFPAILVLFNEIIILIVVLLFSSINFCRRFAAPSRLQLLYTERDYRTEGASASEWKEVNVRSSTEIIFQPKNASKVRKFNLSSVVSLSLSAWNCPNLKDIVVLLFADDIYTLLFIFL